MILSPSPVHSFSNLSRTVNTRLCVASISPVAIRRRTIGSVMLSVCCVATGTLLVDRPDHSICGMSHPLRFA